MMEKRRIGIYGGTFSPPHVGHVASARAMLKALPLDVLYVIPTAQPPHKELAYAIDPADRLALTRIAFEKIPGCTVSDMEIRRGGRSYTSDTLLSLANEDAELYLLCGTDMFLTLDTWHEFRTVFSLATIVYVRRERDGEVERALLEKRARYESLYGARIVEIKNTVIEISSEELRDLICKDSPRASEYLSEDVLAYIEKRGLYRDA